MTSAGATTYHTPYNQLETATAGGVTTSYRYDADNQRRMREGLSGGEYFMPGPGLLPLAEYAEGPAGLVHLRDCLYADGRLLASVETNTQAAWGEAIVRAAHARHATGRADAHVDVRPEHGAGAAGDAAGIRLTSFTYWPDGTLH